MHWTGWIVAALGILLGGWLTFDGTRALTLGDYITPRSGPHAGQLGPWSRVVTVVGLEPRSPLMKAAHVALGLSWLAAVTYLAIRGSAAWWGIAACAIASLWYLPFGTIIGVTELVLLWLTPLRTSGGAG